MADPPDLPIRAVTLADAPAFRECVAAVMRERRWLAYTEPFPLAETLAFIEGNLAAGNPHVVAVDDERIVGWCDIRRETIPSYAHDSMLGMGVVESHRGRRLGERLIRAALEAARAAGFERVSLSVYASNERAQALYRKVGFVDEGRRVRGRKLDGEYDDVVMMACFLSGVGP
jgi:ribosomal protein S18 acetylase RimI-like enzyme